ncbi:hypothetical protein [Kitasatospora sp. MBT63]|uniref:DUF7848 domain-containing protein n=1 Tax=Kitasatospora sp. MBT63 TaxID=1444768 RepID=UPI00053A2CF3|nr:hypothetical protein [Kitasatospora sp. MBT63]
MSETPEAPERSALWAPAHSDCRPRRVGKSETTTRHGDWRLRQDDGPDVDPAAYVLVCRSEAEDGTVCGAESGPVPTTDEMREWARKHEWNHDDHRSFRLLADVAMVMVPEVEPL